MRRNSFIDFLRGVAITLVLLLHFYLAYRAPWLRSISINGNYGVTIFFVISGFLITSTSLSRFGQLSKIDFKSFYRFRFARIIPNITLMVLLVLALGWAGLRIFQNDHGVSMTETVLSIATFTHNVFMKKHEYFNYCLNILWSLSVEEVFYLSFPLLCLVIRNEWALIAVWLGVAIYAPFYRLQHQTNEIIALYDYASCFDGIAIGCITAVLSRKYSVSKKRVQWIVPISGALMTWIYFHDGIMENVVWGISAMALLTAILIISGYRHLPPKTVAESKWFKGVAWLGSHSYELYLFHVVILALMRTVIGRKEINEYFKPFWFLLFMILSALFAKWIAQYYAEPLNRRLRKN